MITSIFAVEEVEAATELEKVVGVGCDCHCRCASCIDVDQAE